MKKNQSPCVEQVRTLVDGRAVNNPQVQRFCTIAKEGEIQFQTGAARLRTLITVSCVNARVSRLYAGATFSTLLLPDTKKNSSFLPRLKGKSSVILAHIQTMHALPNLSS